MKGTKMKSLMPWAASLLLLLSLGTARAQQAVTPGRSVGRVFLGVPRESVWKHIGRPTGVRPLRLADQSYAWDNWQDDRRRETVISLRGRVVQVEHRLMLGDTSSGTSFPSLRRQHPHLRVSLYGPGDEVGTVLYVDDVRRGAAWTLYIYHGYGFGTHLLNEIGLNMVIIHRRGVPVLPDAPYVPIKHDPLLGDLRAWFAGHPVPGD